jgi:hypothetical protein
MGADSDVICLGKFNKSIITYLDYPVDHYEDVKEGTPIISQIFCCNTSNQSNELAMALGVELYDFNTHLFDINKIDWMLLDESFDKEEIERFKVLIKNKFGFMFRPNY